MEYPPAAEDLRAVSTGWPAGMNTHDPPFLRLQIEEGQTGLVFGSKGPQVGTGFVLSHIQVLLKGLLNTFNLISQGHNPLTMVAGPWGLATLVADHLLILPL